MASVAASSRFWSDLESIAGVMRSIPATRRR
jgi:hypothetical protein